MEITEENDLHTPERFRILQDVLYKQFQPFLELAFDDRDLLDNEILESSYFPCGLACLRF